MLTGKDELMIKTLSYSLKASYGSHCFKTKMV